MEIIRNGAIGLLVRDEGPRDGPVLMFSNSLGTDHRVFEPLMPHLPEGLRIVCYDKRGHGLSDAPDAPYVIDDHVSDAAAICEALGLKDIAFVGLSVGGLIGQGLAHARPGLMKALVLMDTAAKIGTVEMWEGRINAIKDGGLASISDAILDRWFSPTLRNDPVRLTPWQNMLLRTPEQGYIGTGYAISKADFRDRVAELTFPIMAMAGEYDQATSPEVVEETAKMYGAPFHLVKEAGHLPCVEQPEVVAGLITDFLKTAGHI